MKTVAILILSFWGILCFNLKAQNEYEPGKVIPPSPTTASLGKFGDIPLNYFTGTPNINIPLYEIDTRGVKVPISLSYDASGIRVSQEASWVGLGWALACGGVITRNIVGLDDFDVGTGYYYREELPPTIDDNEFCAIIGSQAGSDGGDYFNAIRHGSIDGDPDIFSYNFGGYSGKFVMDKEVKGGKVLLSQQNNLKITLEKASSSEGYFKWIITTPDGYQYIFKTPEWTKSYSRGGAYHLQDLYRLNGFVLDDQPGSIYDQGAQPAVSSWYLDSILDPGGNEIVHFTYDTGYKSLSLVNFSFQFFDFMGGTINQWGGGHRIDQEPSTIESCNPGLLSQFYFLTSNREVNSEVYLSEISFNNGKSKLEFRRSQRLDIEPWGEGSYSPEKLDDIKIYFNGEWLKSYWFYYSYFNDYIDPPGNFDNSYYSNRRLKLDSILVLGDDDEKVQSYKFEYFTPQSLPNKYSRAKDMYGFPWIYKSQPIIQGDYYPTMLPELIACGINRLIHFDGYSNCYPDDNQLNLSENLCKSGLLSGITYPTKGKTTFEYELNRYSVESGSIGVLKDREYEVHCIPYVDGWEDVHDYKYEEMFSVSNLEEVTFTPSIFPDQYHEGIPDYTEFFAYLLNENDQIIKSFNDYGSSTTMVLSMGTYKIKIDKIDGYESHFNAKFDEWETAPYMKAGGVRVKSIRNYDTDGKQISCKKFVYTKDGSENGKCSGVLLCKPKLVDDNIEILMECQENGFTKYESGSPFIERSANSLFPLGYSSNSAPIGYNHVYVYDDESGIAGKTEYVYYTHYWDWVDDESIILGIPYNLDPRTGQLLEKNVYNKDGILKQKQTFGYSCLGQDSIKGARNLIPRPSNSDFAPVEFNGMPIVYLTDINANAGYLASCPVYKYYDIRSQWWEQTSEKTIDYLNGGNVETQTFNYYDNVNNKQITKQTRILSDGSNSTSVFKYPNDFMSSNPGTPNVFDRMVLSNVIQPNILTEKYYNNTFLQSREIRYREWENCLFRPETIVSKKEGYTEEERVTFEDYDSYGNILQAKKADDVTTCYIWGYDNVYPVAKIVNADYDLVISKLNLSILNNPANDDVLRSELGKLRTLFPDAQAEIYTYEPLIGMTSFTDVNGQTTYYEYDSFGRLSNVRDNNKDILKYYKYKYKQ